MRILVPLHSFDPGGVERVALRLCRAWRDAEADVRLVMGRADGAMRSEAGGLAFETLGASRWKTLAMIRALPGIIRRERPDALFCAGNTYAVVAVAMKLALGRGCPPVVAKISNDLARRDMPQSLRWFYHRWLRVQGRFIDRFVGMAEPMRAEIAQAMGVAPDTVAIIDDPSLCAADLDRLASPRREGPRHRFLAIGRLVPQKNFALLLDAFAVIARDGDRLVILGEGPLRTALERKIDALGLHDRVSLPGHVGDLPRWFGASDVFVLSSDYEGVPAVVAEALAAGLPIVATDCSVSMADMLGGHGILVPAGDAPALAAAMDAARTAMPDAVAMRVAAGRFTVECAAKLYLELCETVTRP